MKEQKMIPIVVGVGVFLLIVGVAMAVICAYLLSQLHTVTDQTTEILSRLVKTGAKRNAQMGEVLRLLHQLTG